MPRIAAVGNASSLDSPSLEGGDSKPVGTVIGESRVPFHKVSRGGRGGARGGMRGGSRGGRGRGGKREDPLKGGNFNFGVK